MLINHRLQKSPEGQIFGGGQLTDLENSVVGVVAATPGVASLYVDLLLGSCLTDVRALGLSGEDPEADPIGCIVMVLDDGPWREAVIGRCADLKARHPCRAICIYDTDLGEAVRWARNLDVFIFLEATAPASVISSAVVLATYINTFSSTDPLPESDPALRDDPLRDLSPTTLTARQLDVLRLLAKGYSNKAMARTLLLSEPTVKLHLTALRRIFNASNRTEVLSKALRVGLLPY